MQNGGREGGSAEGGDESDMSSFRALQVLRRSDALLYVKPVKVADYWSDVFSGAGVGEQPQLSLVVFGGQWKQGHD